MRYLLVLIAAVLLSSAVDAQLRINLGFNVDRQPIWVRLDTIMLNIITCRILRRTTVFLSICITIRKEDAGLVGHHCLPVTVILTCIMLTKK